MSRPYPRHRSDSRVGFVVRGHEPSPLGLGEKLFVAIHPQLVGTRVEHSWGGKVAITLDRLPHCGRVRLPDGGDVAYATGCNGTGIALATWFGWKAAAWLSGEEPPPAFAQLPFPRVPLHAWRNAYLPAVGWWLKAKDQLGL